MEKKEWLRSLKFLLFSISAGVIQILSFTLFEEVFHWTHWLAYLVSLVLSVLWNFTFNRKFTFHSASNVPIAMLLVAIYYAVFTPLSTLWTNWLTGESVGWNEYLVLVITMVVNFVTEFLYDRFFVFRNSIDTDNQTEEHTNEQTDECKEEAEQTEMVAEDEDFGSIVVDEREETPTDRAE